MNGPMRTRLHLTTRDLICVAAGLILALTLIIAPAAMASPPDDPPADLIDERAVAQLPGEQRRALFIGVAERVWPVGPCTGRYDIRTITGLSIPGIGVDGLAYAFRDDANVPRVRPDLPDGCRIDMRRDLTPYRECQAIVHEIGHMTPAQANVMRPHSDHGIMEPGGLADEAYMPCLEVFPPRVTLDDAYTRAWQRMGDMRLRCKRMSPAVVRCTATARTSGRKRVLTITRTRALTLRVVARANNATRTASPRRP
jgi:hypothetical protein